jgi:DNA-binding XRE family transcriptional regulator
VKIKSLYHKPTSDPWIAEQHVTNCGRVDDQWLLVAFGDRVRQRRGEAGLSQRQVAEAADLSRASVVNVETGRQGVSLGTLYRLARALGCEPAELLPRPPQTETPRIAFGVDDDSSRRVLAGIMHRIPGAGESS